VWDVGIANRRPAADARQPLHLSGLRATAARARALVLVTPTCHGSYSGLVKHSLDQLDAAAVGGKPVVLMATCEGTPTPQAVDHLRTVIAALGAMSIPAHVVASEAGFDAAGDGYRIDDELLQGVRAAVVELAWFVQRLRRPAPGASARRNGAAPPAQRNGDARVAELPDQIARAVEYIRANFAKGQLPLDRVAREACMSRYHFSRSFKRATGTRFVDFVTSLRLAEARTLLADSDDPIGSIALAVGYQHLRPFERSFKREFGLAPSQYRKRLRAGLAVPDGGA
jgi:AraC-like DNA-binding protein